MGTPQRFKRAAQRRRALLLKLARTLARSRGEPLEVLSHGSDAIVIKRRDVVYLLLIGALRPAKS